MINIDYDLVAKKLNEVCLRRNTRDFYLKLNNMGILPALESKIATLPQSNTLEMRKLNLSFKEMQDVVLDFYGALDEDLKETIVKTLDDPFFKHEFYEPKSTNNGEGFVEIFDRDGKSFGKINISPNDNFVGFVVVAHEFAHLLEERNQKKIKQKTDCLAEIAPRFIEKLFIEYAQKCGMINDREAKLLEKDGVYQFVGNVNVLLEENEVLSQLKFPVTGIQLRELHKRYENSGRRGVLMRRVQTMTGVGTQEREPEGGQKRFRYVVGEVVAGAMFEDFKKDPSATLARFKKFLSSNAEIEEQEGYKTLLGDNYVQKIATSLENIGKSPEKTLV